MAKQGAKTAVPRLRFQEFKGKPQWPILKLGTRGRFVGGGTPSRENEKFWTGTNPWISSSDISDEEIRSVRPSRFITDDAVAQSATQAVPAGSVLIVSRVGVGKIAVSEEQLYTSQDFANLFPSSDSPEFLAYLLKSRKSSLLAFNQGMAIKGFTRDDIAGLDVPIPGRPEQQKIADCLTSLNEVITAQGRKVEALKTHKRGLMQQLFPREGETRPRLRFPEFRDAPEWEVKPAGKLFTNRKEDGEEGLPIYSVTVNDGMILRASFDRDFYDIAEPAGNKKVHEGDIAYNMMRMWQGAQGVAIEDCMVSPAYVVLSPRESVCSRFFAYMFKLPQSLELLTAYSRGLTKDRLRLYFDDFARLPLYVAGYAEQQRIADCLSSLDTKIAAESDQFVALKAHKQGLMQQLLPAQGAG